MGYVPTALSKEGSTFFVMIRNKPIKAQGIPINKLVMETPQSTANVIMQNATGLSLPRKSTLLTGVDHKYFEALRAIYKNFK